MFWGVSYILAHIHTIYITILVRFQPSFSPQLIFHNSNTAETPLPPMIYWNNRHCCVCCDILRNHAWNGGRVVLQSTLVCWRLSVNECVLLHPRHPAIASTPSQARSWWTGEVDSIRARSDSWSSSTRTWSSLRPPTPSTGTGHWGPQRGSITPHLHPQSPNGLMAGVQGVIFPLPKFWVIRKFLSSDRLTPSAVAGWWGGEGVWVPHWVVAGAGRERQLLPL